MVRAIIEFDDEVYQRLREMAAQRNTSLEQLVAQEARQWISGRYQPAEPGRTMGDFLDTVDDIVLDLGDWKWKRDDLYDRQVLR